MRRVFTAPPAGMTPLSERAQVTVDRCKEKSLNRAPVQPSKLNGLEAGRQISNLVPSAKIIFLTQESDVDVVREAFSLGAWGYVLKESAESDLLAALASALRGEQFVSSRLDNI